MLSVLGTTDKTFLVSAISVLTLCGNKRLYCIQCIVMYKSLRTRKSIYVQRLCLVKLVISFSGHTRPEEKERTKK